VCKRGAADKENPARETNIGAAVQGQPGLARLNPVPEPSTIVLAGHRRRRGLRVGCSETWLAGKIAIGDVPLKEAQTNGS